MTSLTIRTKISDTSFSSPELKKFLGDEVEIVIKKIAGKRKKDLNKAITKIHEMVRKHVPEGVELSSDLIRERRREAINE